MSDLIAEIQRSVGRKSELRLLDAIATGANTVQVGGSTVSVTLPAIVPVVSGDFCQVLRDGANSVIVGPVGASPDNFSVTSVHANLTSVTVARGTRLGPIEIVQVLFTCSVTQIVGSASLFTIPSAWWPGTNTSTRGANVNAAGAGVDLILSTAGVVTVSTGSTVAASQPYSASFVNIT